jgi:hypothetical protein
MYSNEIYYDIRSIVRMCATLNVWISKILNLLNVFYMMLISPTKGKNNRVQTKGFQNFVQKMMNGILTGEIWLAI